MTSIKICGLQLGETIDAIADLPIDQLGFIFAASKRRVTPEQAGRLIDRLKTAVPAERRPLTAGVFVGAGIAELEGVLAEAPLDIIQLHSGESAGFCREVKERFGVRVYKVVSIASFEGGAESAVAGLEAYRGAADAVLLDTHDPATGGGTGRTFNWEVIPAYLEWAERSGIRLIVAGGLQPDNVAELIRSYRPHGVDVSSGVETNGVKDPAKIRTFVERVKGAI